MVLTWRLIPDGTATILELTIELRQNLRSESASTDAEQLVAEVVNRLTDRPVRDVLDRIEAEKWLGEGERPKESRYVDRGGYCDVCGGWHKGACP